ncbi:hypothetical protein ZTR_00645 [Talaromyces verruculosus]|nr:hypothetical protein ZTR_00645 [Talaromyces verruculosus]
MPQPRYPGHGFDFRRPIMSSTTPSRTEEVVDLTNEPDSPPLPSRHSSSSNRPAHRHRPPRFGRNIMTEVIDLEEEEEEEEEEEDGDDSEDRQTEVINLDPPGSPEVQFVRATSRPSRGSLFPAPSHLLDVINFHAQQGFLSTQEAFRQEIALQTRRMGRYLPNRPNMDEIFLSGDGIRNFDLPDLNYQAPGFTIHEPPPSTPPPSYKPPSPPPEGFIRTVSEDDVVVYCGECTINRAMSSRKKTTAPSSTFGPSKPFSKCKVAGCEKSVSQPKSMMQIYL